MDLQTFKDYISRRDAKRFFDMMDYMNQVDGDDTLPVIQPPGRTQARTSTTTPGVDDFPDDDDDEYENDQEELMLISSSLLGAAKQMLGFYGDPDLTGSMLTPSDQLQMLGLAEEIRQFQERLEQVKG